MPRDRNRKTGYKWKDWRRWERVFRLFVFTSGTSLEPSHHAERLKTRLFPLNCAPTSDRFKPSRDLHIRLFQRCYFVCRLELLVLCGLLTCVEQKSSASPQGWWCNYSNSSGRVGLFESSSARNVWELNNYLKKNKNKKDKHIWPTDGFGNISWHHAPVRQLREAHSW